MFHPPTQMTPRSIDIANRPSHAVVMDEMRTEIYTVSGAAWAVYRVQTASSRYSLGVYPGSGERRRCAVLRGWSHGAHVNAEDSAPLVGDKSLFELSPSEWIGQRLQIGTTKMSPVRSVELEDDPTVITSITSGAPMVITSRQMAPVAASAEPERPKRQRPAYPADMVEYAETAASLLRAVYAKEGLAGDLRGQVDLERRFKVAVGECFLVLKALGERFVEREG